jgi:hypothetical protein
MPSDIANYLKQCVPVTDVCKGQNTFYYAFLPNANIAALESDRLVSYDDYLKQSAITNLFSVQS